jgi:hypothetical protein
MSDFPFQGQTAVTDAPETDLEPPGSRSRVMVLVGLVAVALVGLLAYLFLFAGGDEGESASSAPPPAAAPAAPAEEPATAPKAAKKEKISAKSFGRDPFEPLIVEAVAGAASGADGSGAVTGTGTDSSTGTGGTAADAGSAGGSSPGSTGGSGSGGSVAPAPADSHSFKVLDVAPDNSTVTVKLDGDTYRNLRAGEVFAEVFKVRFIGGAVNSFQIGDEVFNVSGNKKVTVSG